jgi:uncharacterized caspase-like protein
MTPRFLFTRTARWLALIAMFGLGLCADARADKRVALVIGNSSYQNVAKLPNPVRDANGISDLLKKAGFNVVDARRDLGNLELKRALRDFSFIARDADIAVVFFAGHGIEVGGINYMIPVDARLATDFDVEDEAVALDRIVKALEPVRRLRLVILDACRDNPFTGAMKRTLVTRAVVRGLAVVEPSSPNTLIAFAARAGSTAEDGNGEHSPFTAALIKHITVPGLDIRIAFGKVRDEVLRNTANRQEPFVYGSLGGDSVALVPLPATPASPSMADMRRDYELAAQVNTREAWTSFLALYPKGFYADLARGQNAKLAALGATQEAEQARAAKAKIETAEKERADLERRAREQLDRERIAKEQADRAAKEQAEQIRLAKAKAELAEKERADAERRTREQLERERIAKEQAERERIAKEQAERERLEREAAEKAQREKAKADVQVAALTPAQPAPAPAPLSGPALVREIKKELTRLGCYESRVDEKWDSTETRASVQKFTKYAKLDVAPADPNEGFLNTLRGKTGRICPLECGVREVESNGRCVTKTCSSGQRLDNSGKCIAAAEHKSKREPGSRGGRRCFSLGAQSYCE